MAIYKSLYTILKNIDEMQAVILVGGRGTRLGALTKNKPKPMLIVNKKPFLEHLLVRLRSSGIKNILLCIGYLGHKIKDYFKDGSWLGLNIDYSIEHSLLGTGGALKKAETFLNQDFILMNGDTYLPIDYRELLQYFKDQNKLGVVVVYSNKNKNGNIRVEKVLVTKYDKKSKNLEFTDAGVQVFKKDILRLIPSNKFISLEEEIFPKLVKSRQLAAYTTRQEFFDIGTHKGLRAIQKVLK